MDNDEAVIWREGPRRVGELGTPQIFTYRSLTNTARICNLCLARMTLPSEPQYLGDLSHGQSLSGHFILRAK